ncbi:MAG TPA: PaaI family thioesterase [Xanthobacteraceae bacterium]|nr:PaaI family thioesterase [Xanthobacteraceae bacterium]
MNDQTVADGLSFDPAAHGWERIKGHNFGELVGPIWRRGDGRFGIVAADKHRNHRSVIHGGVLMSLADQAMGMTGRRATGDKPHATIEMNMQFIGAVKVGDFVEAHCEVVRQTRSILFIESKLKVGARIVAAASGIWKILNE